jgi:hypothetical protein
MKKGIAVSLASSVVLSSLLIGTAFAQSTTQPPQGGQQGWGGMGRGHMMGRAPGIFGTVSAVSGATVTVTTKAGPNGTPAAQTYTVDASNATVSKNGSSSSVSSIAVGDTVMVQGTVSGTSVTAKTIRDGIPQRGMRGQGDNGQGQPLPMQGNGQPVIGGSVTAVSGSTLSVQTAQGQITYSVDASSATVRKGNATSTVSSVAVGDKVVVQGTVNGTSVVASSVIDQGSVSAGQPAGDGNENHPGLGGFFGALGGLFHRLFGFF